jgi:DHA1 family bicyclomycin/chloramphenicol resistance-like MFS transporter
MTSRFSWFALYCGLMLSISAFSIDIMLPSMLSIGQGLNTPLQSVQLTIPVYMLALGLANPVFGVLSDRIGRRPGIFIGLAIYTFGAAVCALAPNIEVLLTGRFLQGFGAACAPVICRAMIRDRYSGVQLAQTMAVASMFFAMGPLLAPLLGYLLYVTAGWRAVFLLLIGLSLIMLVSTWYQRETLPLEARRAQNFSSIWLDASAVIRHRGSRTFIILSCVATSIILTFLAHAPVIYANLGASEGRFSVMFACTSVGIVLGQLINHRLLSVITAARVAMYAAVVVAATSIVIWVAAIADALTIVSFTVLMFMFNTSYLLIFSNLVSLILEPHGNRAGMASSMFGFFSYIGGSLLAAALALVTDEQTSRWAFCFMLISLTLLGGLFYAVKRSEYN